MFIMEAQKNSRDTIT